MTPTTIEQKFATALKPPSDTTVSKVLLLATPRRLGAGRPQAANCKTLTHNFVDNCVSIDKLTRLVAQVFIPYAGIYTPLAVTVPGHQTPVPSFLYLHAQSLVVALDYHAQETLISGWLPAGDTLLMTPSGVLTQLLETALPFYGDLCAAVRRLQEESRKRKRKSTAGGIVEIVAKKR